MIETTRMGRPLKGSEKGRNRVPDIGTVVKIDQENYEDARGLSERSGIPITRIINELVAYGLQRATITCVPTYRYELNFDDAGADADE